MTTHTVSSTTPTLPTTQPPLPTPTAPPEGPEESPPYDESLRKAHVVRGPGPHQAPGQPQTLVEPNVGSGK